MLSSDLMPIKEPMRLKRKQKAVCRSGSIPNRFESGAARKH
jgi:hypothetical protein